MRKYLPFIAALLLALGVSADAQQYSGYNGGNFIAKVPPNCVVYATAGGTGDAITIPLMTNPSVPCTPTQTMLVVTLTATNTTPTPTLKPFNFPAELVKKIDGTVLSVGQLAAGSLAVMVNDGSAWRLISAGGGGAVPISITGDHGVATSPSPIATTGVVVLANIPDHTALANISGSTTYPTPTTIATTGHVLVLADQRNAWAAQQAALQTVPLVGSAFTPNMSGFQYFKLTLDHAACPCTIANPTGLTVTPGFTTSGIMDITQSSSGSDTVNWGTAYQTTAGLKPTLTTAGNATDFFCWYSEDGINVVVSACAQNAKQIVN